MSQENWIAPPEWANCTVFFQNDDPILKNFAHQNHQHLVQEIQQAFQTIIRSPMRAQHFIGRQAFAWSPDHPAQVWVDTEICKLARRATGEVFISRRFLLPLLWNPEPRQVTVMLDHDRKWESPITKLELHLITPTLQTVERGNDFTETDQEFLESHWEEILKRIQQGAEEMLQDQSNPGGDFGGSGWPDRIEMTGEYALEFSKVEEPDRIRFMVSVVFRHQPWEKDSDRKNYMWLDLNLEFHADEQWTFEIWSTGVA